MIVDAVLCLLFLVTFAFVGLPLTNYMIRHTSISDKEYNLGVNADGTPMDLDGSVEWFDIAEDVEWKDPLETINPDDMVTYVTIPDRTASSTILPASKENRRELKKLSAVFAIFVLERGGKEWL